MTDGRHAWPGRPAAVAPSVPCPAPAPCALRPPAQAHFGGIPILFVALHPLLAACPATFAMLRLRSSPASFLSPPSPSFAAPRSASPPFCPSLGRQGHVVGFKLTPSATRRPRKVVVMANSAPAAAAPPLSSSGAPPALRLLFVEMGTGYDQHGYVFWVWNLLFFSSSFLFGHGHLFQSGLFFHCCRSRPSARFVRDSVYRANLQMLCSHTRLRPHFSKLGFSFAFLHSFSEQRIWCSYFFRTRNSVVKLFMRLRIQS